MTKRKDDDKFIKPPRKFRLIDTNLPFIDDYNLESNNKEEEIKEYIIITKKVNTIKDLIELGKEYDNNKLYNIDMKVLNKLVEPLTELDNMIGMDKIKDDIVDHILFFIQKLEIRNYDMMHTVIQGPPGTGKTEVAKIIGRIYLAMGFLKNDTFIKATRSTLIGQYLGQTAHATQKTINSAVGGVLFIDEVYSLGNPEKRDSYSKECIDTINENLTDKKTEFICIIAGYKEDIDKCFFSVNKGLERRFPIRFTIDKYEAKDLYLIFKKKVHDVEWMLDESVTETFFIDKYNDFPNFGGDMENLFSKCKKAHARRIFGTTEVSKLITLADMIKGHKTLTMHMKCQVDAKDEMWKEMFL